ncbi:MAG: ribonuclease D [Candidatus Rokubacteria bacterium]|nr:ribonuclease D [Candidatus Rokubacteria bacterium]
MTPPPTWVRTPADLLGLARDLAGTSALALDTEADSLHHYPERLCLIQVGDPEGRVFFVDPLALADLEPLRPICADPATLKVFHSAENDLAHFKRRFGFAFASIRDTALAARLLGARELGLDTLLGRYLGVALPKSQQKADWARRPLTPVQEAYAAADVRHLISLGDRLVAELRALGREAWFTEECEALAALPVTERAPEEDGSRRLRGASRLDPRGRAVLRALHAQREAWARSERRPPFKVLSPETLIALAAARPRSRATLAGIPGLPPRLVERYGEGILESVARGLAAPLVEPPRARRPVVPPVVLQRAAALKRWRVAAAERTGLDPGVLLPQRLIDALAAAHPTDVPALAAVPGVRRWRAEAFGTEILAALVGRTV